MRVHRIACFCALLAILLPGCTTPEEKEQKAKDKEKKEKLKEKQKSPFKPEVAQDTGFQSFLGRLRIAASKRDQNALRSFMAPGFGWRWEENPPGDPFSYWTENRMWEDLDRVLNAKFVPHEDFMVSPPEFASDPNGYEGPRAGLKLINGSWRFAYFVTGRDIVQ